MPIACRIQRAASESIDDHYRWFGQTRFGVMLDGTL